MGSVPSLFSLVLLLSPAEEVKIGATVGHRAHAAFLRAIEAVDPALSAALHAPNRSPRPFTVSPLRGIPPARSGTVRLSPERTVWLRITLLLRPLYERLMESFLRDDQRPLLQLGSATFWIREVRVTPGSHPWAGYASWEELAAAAGPERELTLEFASPTAFSFGRKEWGHQMIVLPLPERVFGSLARTWNAFAPSSLQLEARTLKGYTAEHVVIKEIENLNTHMLDFSGRPQVGFTGRVTYGLMGENDSVRQQLTMLADFAFYAGVGYKTTMGMGQARRVARGQGRGFEPGRMSRETGVEET